MALFDKPLAQIDEHDLLRLISDKAAESKTHDYKRDLVAQADGDKKEFLYDASSFANTQGGNLIFGVAEAKGVPRVGSPCLGPSVDLTGKRLFCRTISSSTGCSSSSAFCVDLCNK